MEIFYSKYIFLHLLWATGSFIIFFLFLLILLSQKLFKIIIQTLLNNHSFENFKDSLEEKKRNLETIEINDPDLSWRNKIPESRGEEKLISRVIRNEAFSALAYRQRLLENATVSEDQISDRQLRKLIDANRSSSSHEIIALGLLLQISSLDL